MIQRNTYRHIILNPTICGVSILVLSLYSILSYLIPLQLDDYVFRTSFIETSGSSTDFNIKGFTDFIRQGALNDNIRLSNITGIFFFLPTGAFYWFPILNAIFFLISLLSIYSLSRNGSESLIPQLSIWIWGAMIIFLPWRNSIFVRAYALNYIWSGGFILLFFLCILRYLHSRKPLFAFLSSLLLIPAALFHEGFAIPFFGALFCFSLYRIIIKKQSLPTTWISLVVIFGILSSLPMLTPGMMARSSREISSSLSPIILIDYFLPVIIILLLIILYLLSLNNGEKAEFCRRFLAGLFSDDTFFIAIFTMIFSGILSLCFHHTPRMSYLPNLMGILISFRMAYPYIAQNSRRLVFRIFSLLILAGILVQSALSITAQYRLNEEHDEIMERLKISSTGTVFFDFTGRRDLNPLTLYMPACSEWNTIYSFSSLAEGLKEMEGFHSLRNPMVLPTSLRNASPGVFPEGIVVTRDVAPALSAGRYSIKSEDGDEVEINACAYPFVNLAGDSLTLLRPL